MSTLQFLIFVILSNWKECNGILLRGTRAQDGEFPWLVQFQTIVPCGGVLVSPDWVLTAAQCIQTQRNSIIIYATGLNGTGSHQSIGVKATYIHPRYQSRFGYEDHENNIALVKLVRAFDMCNSEIKVLDIARVGIDSFEIHKNCFIFGWQSYVLPTLKVLAKPIQFSQVTINLWSYCTYLMRQSSNYTKVFCAMVEEKEGLKACAGNPGSPVMCKDKVDKWILLGIASWSNYSLDCSGLPTYISVEFFRSWMYNLIVNDRKLKDAEWTSGNGGLCRQNSFLAQLKNPQQNATESSIKVQPQIEETPKRIQRKSNTQKNSIIIQEYDSVLPYDDVANDYSLLSSVNPFANVVKVRENNMRQFQEIGEKSNSDLLDKSSNGNFPKITTSSIRRKHKGVDDLEDIDNFLLYNYKAGCLHEFLYSKYLILYSLFFLHLYIIYTLH